MGDIVEFGRKEPTLTGQAICTVCRHEWVSVSPAGTFELECPDCKSTKAVFKHFVDRSDQEHFKCNCGNFLFSVTKNGIYCVNCANWVYPYA